MSSTIKVDNIKNLAGDDSGIDLSTNDQIILKTANTTAITVNSSQNVALASTASVSGLLTASSGVAIGGTGSANTIDDYEEGTWTPTISSSSGTITTVGTVSGIYVKIGRMVTLNWHFAITTNGTGAGFINIDGLPFSSSSQGAGGSARDRSASGVMSVLQMDGAVSRINQYQYNNAYPGANGAKWYCTITFQTA